MKIDESAIDHNAMKLIDCLALWEMTDTDMNMDKFTLGFIQGVKEMADAMKEVLKA